MARRASRPWPDSRDPSTHTLLKGAAKRQGDTCAASQMRSARGRIGQRQAAARRSFACLTPTRAVVISLMVPQKLFKSCTIPKSYVPLVFSSSLEPLSGSGGHQVRACGTVLPTLVRPATPTKTVFSKHERSHTEDRALPIGPGISRPFSTEVQMPYQPNVLAIDMDSASLASLRQAFPEWVIEAINGAASSAVAQDCNLGTVELLVVGFQDRVAEMLALCRALRSQMGRALAPLLVLVPPENDDLVRKALAAGAQSCLVLPVHPKDFISMLARARQGNQPGRHTLNLNRAQREDRWRDDGGEA
jgi:CheY-like chemotaxis protein